MVNNKCSLASLFTVLGITCHARAVFALVSSARTATNTLKPPEVRWWTWKGHKIRYQVSDPGVSSDMPGIVCIHGFGGNSDHWRKNLPELSETGSPVYAIDLLGYGFSDKPSPGSWEQRNSVYNFENWSQLVDTFIEEEVKRKSFVVCNSVGGIVGLQLAVDDAETRSEAERQVLGCVVFNVSLRMLHETKQAPFAKPFIKGLQWCLRETALGPNFFKNVASFDAVKSVLKECYGDPSAVTDELVNAILQPGLTEGAPEVFLDFISYSSGPLAEELLPRVKVPVVFGWGTADPWEPLAQGRAYGNFDCVESFIEMKGVGHCPQDEAPALANEIIRNFVVNHAPCK